MEEKNSRSYYIMHKDLPTCKVGLDGTCEIFEEAFLPYGIYLENESILDNRIDIRLNNLENFYHWCATRMLTLDRVYAKEILNSIGRSQAVTDRDRAEIAIAYRCLSLTDVYWIKTEEDSAVYETINLYDHSLSDAFVDVALRGKQLSAQNAGLIDDADVAGDIGTAGVTPKAWIRRNGEFLLLKDGDEKEVRAELLASKIIDCFDVDHVRYEADEYDGKLVSSSKIMTGHDKSIVPFEHVEIYAMNHDIDIWEFIKIKDNYSYQMMNIMDYLVGNTDRHRGNWGFMADNESNKLLGLHPLMDFNKAFLSYDTEEGARCLTTSQNMSQKEAAIIAVKETGLNQVADVDESWFEEFGDPKILAMFNKRFEVLRNIEV